jgi:molybdenum cofactor guanylyltransferase
MTALAPAHPMTGLAPAHAMTASPDPRNNMPELYGLVLAGGLSSRMQRDKAALAYRGKNQLDRVYALAARHARQVFVSVRAHQIHEPTRADKPLIVDSVEGEGPIVGIRSAQRAHPGVAWLVLACDLPFLSDAALAHLVKHRDPSAVATAYSSAHDGLPEPLCAIWEPAAVAALDAYQQGGGKCPRKFLIRSAALLIEPLDKRALDNVNTPAEYAEAMHLLDNGTDDISCRRPFCTTPYCASKPAAPSNPSIPTRRPPPICIWNSPLDTGSPCRRGN